MFLRVCYPKVATHLHIPTITTKGSDRIYVLFPYGSYKNVSWRFEPDFFVDDVDCVFIHCISLIKYPLKYFYILKIWPLCL